MSESDQSEHPDRNCEARERPNPDQVLVERALRGDDAAWQAIVDRYAGLAFATARRCGLDRPSAEDVAQSVFASLVKSLATLRDSGSLAGWIVTTSRRAAWRVARQAQQARQARDLLASAPVEEPLADPAEEIAAFERRSQVRTALSMIDERCRALLQALFGGTGDPDYAAIGTRFGIAVNSVGPIRNRCLQRLLEALEKVGFRPRRGADFDAR